MNLRIDELAALVGAEWTPGTTPVGRLTNFGDLGSATPEDVAFFSNRAYLRQLCSTKAGAVLVAKDFAEPVTGPALLRVDNPSLAFAEIVARFGPRPSRPEVGVHERAVVHPEATLDPAKVSIAAGAVIDRGAEIGDGTVIGANCFIGESARLGKDCLIHPNVTIREHCVLGNRVILQPGVVIGGDGFGFEFVNGRHEKVPQLGIVQIDDDVEIGANSSVDRARFGRTWIQEGAKIDNLVQVAHNVVIGRHAIVVAQTGIAGSAKIGDYSVIAAQSGVAGHLEVGPKATLAARSGVTKDLPGGQIYSGFPARPVNEARRALVVNRTVERLLERVRGLERRLESDSRQDPPEPEGRET